jgi:hypothetical protein
LNEIVLEAELDKDLPDARQQNYTGIANRRHPWRRGGF